MVPVECQGGPGGLLVTVTLLLTYMTDLIVHLSFFFCQAYIVIVGTVIDLGSLLLHACRTACARTSS